MNKNNKANNVNNSSEVSKGAKLPKSVERKPIFSVKEREAIQRNRKVETIITFLTEDKKCRLVTRPQIMPDSIIEFADTVAGNQGHFGVTTSK